MSRVTRSLVAACLVLSVPGCAEPDDGGEADSTAAMAAEGATLHAQASPETAAAVQEVARPVAAALMESLGGALTAELSEGDAVSAMEFCNVQAMPLTDAVGAEYGLDIKRTSWRVRNPENAPDALEEVALAHFADVASTGEGPRPWVQPDPDGGYRFYQPLPTGALCARCHGTADRLDPGVSEALERLYPLDRATGFAEGELRGLIRISVPEEALGGG